MEGIAPAYAGVSVVVPVKDEAGNAGALAREIAAALAAEQGLEIIFVDDGSKDGTAAELIALKSQLPIRILSHARNLGQSRAMLTGVRAARNALVITLDGDGQNDPADIPKLLALFREHASNPDFAMAAGERVKRQDSLAKRMASRSANAIRRAALGDSANDTGCSLKAFKREAYLMLPYFDHMHRYLITLMEREGYEVRYVGVSHRPRGNGRSKYGNWDRAIAGLYDLFGVRWLKRRFKGKAEIKEL